MRLLSHIRHENDSVYTHAETTNYHEHTINDNESTHCDTTSDFIIGKIIFRPPSYLDT